MKLLLLLS